MPFELMVALVSQIWPGGHLNSPMAQGCAHWQEPFDFTQSLPMLQRGVGVVLSTCPSQSLSLQSQVSGVAAWLPRQVKRPFTQASWPCLHSPWLEPQASPMLALGGGNGLAVPSMPSG